MGEDEWLEMVFDLLFVAHVDRLDFSDWHCELLIDVREFAFYKDERQDRNGEVIVEFSFSFHWTSFCSSNFYFFEQGIFE